jgi:hypothetical protein
MATSNRLEERTAAMSQDVTPPTFKEALKQDRAEFEDCTPCRLVGMLCCPVVHIYNRTVTDLAQAAPPLSASVPLPTCLDTRSCKRMKPPYGQARACSACAAEEPPSPAPRPSWSGSACTGGSHEGADLDINEWLGMYICSKLCLYHDGSLDSCTQYADTVLLGPELTNKVTPKE